MTVNICIGYILVLYNFCLKTVSIDLRKTILKIHSLGYKVTFISRILDMPNLTVWNIIRKFQTTKEVADLPRTGRPKCIRTPKKIKAIRERVQRNPKRSMRKMASEVGIRKSSIHRLIHEDLKMKSQVLQKHQFLSDLQKKKRLERCKILHDEIESGKSGENVLKSYFKNFPRRMVHPLYES